MKGEAMVVTTYEYPLSPEGAERFLSQADRWIKAVLAFKGALQWRVYRNAEATSPTVMNVLEFDTLDHAFAAIPAAAVVHREMRQFGASNIQYQIWATSPYYPEPVSR